jgi:hypothetical protein
MPIRELQIPQGAVRTPDADEILRVFINADKKMDLVLSSGFDDPATWGMLLADVARYAASAYVAKGDNRERTLKRIRERFLEETDPGLSDAKR